MTRPPEDATGDLLNVTRRYFAKVLGKYIEMELKIDSTWRDSGWDEVKAFFNNKCVYCEAQEGDTKTRYKASKKGGQPKEEKYEVTLEKEHLDNIVDGGLDVRGNVVPACKDCNRSKKHRTWIQFLEYKVKEEFDEDDTDNPQIAHLINEREKKILDYRNSDLCKWKEVEQLDKTKLSKLLTVNAQEYMEQQALRWITATIYMEEGLYDYIYHVTTATLWEEAVKEENNKYPLDKEQDNIIKCSYESLLYRISEKFQFTEEDDLVIISFGTKKINYRSIKTVNFEGEYYQHIIGPLENINDLINEGTIKVSAPFKLENYENIKNALETIDHTLTKQGKKFPGYEPK